MSYAKAPIDMEQDYFLPPSSGYVPTETIHNSPEGLHYRRWNPSPGMGVVVDSSLIDRMRAATSAQAYEVVSADGMHPAVKGLLVVGLLAGLGVGGALIYKKVRS